MSVHDACSVSVPWCVQVKLRGFRIELGEMEAALADVPGVQLAAALVLQGPHRAPSSWSATSRPQRRPSGSAGQAEGAPAGAHGAAAGHAAAQMPLLPNEKVDRKALARPESSRTGQRRRADEYVAPRSELEAAVQAVWQEVLGLEQVSVESRLLPHRRQLHHGQQGHLAPARRAGRAAVGRRAVPAPHHCCAGQAAGGGRRGRARPGGAAQIVPAAGYDAAALAAGVPASSQQEQLLRARAGPPDVHGGAAARSAWSAAGRRRAVGAWEALVMRHAVLRTRFKEDGERLLQVLLAPCLRQLHLVLQCIRHAVNRVLTCRMVRGEGGGAWRRQLPHAL